MNAYDILGLTPTSSRSELEQTYQRLRAAYEPTRVSHLGTEFEGIARNRLQEIERAYVQLRPALALPTSLAPEHERRRDRETIVALLVLLALALAVLGMRDMAVPERTAIVTAANAEGLDSKPAPDFRLEQLGGGQVSLSEYRGKVVLVNFWATWCPPCVREIPALVRIHEQYRDQGFVILGVNTTYQDDEAKVQQFVQDNNIQFPILLEKEATVGSEYGARLMPSSYLIDQNGQIVYAHVGQIDEQSVAERVQALLGK